MYVTKLQLRTCMSVILALKLKCTDVRSRHDRCYVRYIAVNFQLECKNHEIMANKPLYSEQNGSDDKQH